MRGKSDSQPIRNLFEAVGQLLAIPEGKPVPLDLVARIKAILAKAPLVRSQAGETLESLSAMEGEFNRERVRETAHVWVGATLGELAWARGDGLAQKVGLVGKAQSSM